MLLSEFGQLLSEARIKKELSIDDVALRLKISARVVRALEDGNLDNLLHGTYVCSFTRTYAKFLDLDSDLIDDMIESIDVKNIVQSIPVPPGHNRTHHYNIKYYAALLVVLLMAVGGIWYLINANIFPLNFKSADLLTIIQPNTTKQDSTIKDHDKASATSSNDAQTADNVKIDAEATSVLDNIDKDAENAAVLNKDENQENIEGANLTLDNDENTNENTAATEQNPSDIAQKAIAAQKIEAAKAEEEKAIAAQKIAAAKAEEEKAIAAQKIAAAKAANEKAIAAQKIAAAKAEEEKAIAAQAVNDKKIALNTDVNADDAAHKMIITALEVCWISSNADNTNRRQFTLQKGSTFALTFARTLTLKLGNAGGISIRYNGKDLPPLGKVGEVKTIKFP